MDERQYDTRFGSGCFMVQYCIRVDYAIALSQLRQTRLRVGELLPVGAAALKDPSLESDLATREQRRKLSSRHRPLLLARGRVPPACHVHLRCFGSGGLEAAAAPADRRAAAAAACAAVRLPCHGLYLGGWTRRDRYVGPGADRGGTGLWRERANAVVARRACRLLCSAPQLLLSVSNGGLTRFRR